MMTDLWNYKDTWIQEDIQAQSNENRKSISN